MKDNADKRADRIRAKLSNGKHATKAPRILLGSRGGEPFYLEGKDLDNSIHIMGATREGKSKQLENIFRQFIDQGIGGAIIDPHGYLYDDLVAYCSYQGARRPEIMDRIVLFDPGDDEYVVGFNTLEQIPGLDDDMLALSRMYATIKARGLDNFDNMPTAKVWLNNIFMPLIKKGLTLIEARHLIDRGLKSNPTAQAIVRGTGVDLIDHDWTWYADQPKRTQYEELLSSINMLRNFVTSERLQLIFGRQRNVLNLRSIMDEGKLLLINLSSRKLHQDLARLVGTLLVNEFFLVSKTRPEGSRPFYLAIDEFENYVTQDIADILDQGHKFGLRLILAHHSLEQLKEQNERVYAAVMQNAKVKILYGGLTYDNAEILVKELFTYIGQGGLDPKAIKHIQESPYLEPRESTRTVRSAGQSESRSSGTSQSESSASGSSSGYAMVSGETSIPVDSLFLSDEIVQYITSTSSQTGESSQQGSGSGSFESESSGHSYTDSIVPFIEQNLKWYESSIQFSSLDEQVYSLVARMKNLPQQVCMVKLPKQAVATVRSTYVVTHHRLEGETEQFAKRLNQRSPYHALPAAAREERLRITDSLTNPPAEEPDSEDERWQ